MNRLVLVLWEISLDVGFYKILLFFDDLCLFMFGYSFGFEF